MKLHYNILYGPIDNSILLATRTHPVELDQQQYQSSAHH